MLASKAAAVDISAISGAIDSTLGPVNNVLGLVTFAMDFIPTEDDVKGTRLAIGVNQQDDSRKDYINLFKCWGADVLGDKLTIHEGWQDSCSMGF